MSSASACPNIAKSFHIGHIGHLWSTIICAFLANLYRASVWGVISTKELGCARCAPALRTHQAHHAVQHLLKATFFKRIDEEKEEGLTSWRVWRELQRSARG